MSYKLAGVIWNDDGTMTTKGGGAVMTKREQIKYKLFNDLNAFESDLTRITVRQYKRIMRLVNKISKKVEKYYE